MESSVNTFSKGLNRDISLTKYSPENYFEALNVKLITDEAISSGQLTNEKGNVINFKIPAVQALYEIKLNVTSGSFIISINGTNSQPNSQSWTYATLCTYLRTAYAAQISAGQFGIYNQADRVIVVGFNVALIVASFGTSITVTNVLPQLQKPSIIGGVQLRDYLIVYTTAPSILDIGQTTISNGQIWKLKILENGVVEDIGSSNYLIPSKHLIYNDQLNFSVEHRIESYSNYETPEVGKTYFTDYNNNFRHFNVLDPETFSTPLSALEIVPEVTFGITSIIEVKESGSYKSGVVQYAHQYYNLHGSQSSFSKPTGLVHLTKSADNLSNGTQLYFGTATEKPTGKAVKLQISNLDSSFTNIRVVALFYKTLNGTPEITIVEDREIPPSGTIFVTDSGDSLQGTVTDIEFTTIGSTNFKCKSMDVKDNILFPANIEEEFYDVDAEGYWDSRAYRFNRTGVARVWSSDNTFIDLTSAAVLAEDHDCIQTKENQTPNITPTSSNSYCYTLTGTKRFGGEGPNVKYYFNIDAVVGDSYPKNGNVLYTELTATGYSDYANPILQANKTGYLRDEVYRFGIVFIDKNGRKSFVKWISDIKMPSVRDVDLIGQKFRTFYYDNNKCYFNILSVTFVVSNIPASAESFEIVRMKRDDSDKTVLSQGVLSVVLNSTGALSCPAGDVSTSGQITSTKRLFNYLSPDVNFLKKTFPTGSLQIIGLGTAELSNYNQPGSEGHQIRLKVYDLYTHPSSDMTPTNIIESRILPPGFNATYTINNYNYKNYRASGSVNYGYMCTNLVVSTNSAVNTFIGGAYDNKFAITNIVRSLSNQYGGNSFSARLNNKYISCVSEIANGVARVYGGDTFITYFDMLFGYYDTTATSAPYNNYTENFNFPVESSLNLTLRHDVCYMKQSSANDYYKYLMTEVAGVHTDNTGSESFTQETDLYLYNQAYSRESDTVNYFSKPLNFSENRVFDARILSSQPKKTNEEIDSWTSFLATNYTDVDATYGPINKIVAFRNKLFFLQDKAIGWTSVNEKSLITPDASGTTLALGKGGILDQYFYISRHSGCKHQFSVTTTPNGVYYYDAANNRINVFTGEQNEPISELKGFSSYLKKMILTGVRKTDQTINGIGVHSTYDQRFNRVLFTFNDMFSPDEFTIGYNEMIQAFESFYSFKPRLYLKFDDYTYSTDPSNLEKTYLHNAGNYAEFYDSTYDSEITIVVNKDPYRTKAFTNLEYGLNTTPESNINFEALQVYNNYQDTGVIPLTISNCNRRARMWRITIGRNNDSYSVSDRILSEAAFVKLIFDNSNSSNVRFVLNDIITHYMPKSL